VRMSQVYRLTIRDGRCRKRVINEMKMGQQKVTKKQRYTR
jgi:hypothetical protein